MSTAAGSDEVQGWVVIDRVSHWYRSRGEPIHALEDISLSFAEGEFVAIVGPSGCGKTTLLQLVAGFLTPDVGEIRIDGRSVEGPGHDRGVVFQQSTLYPWWTVRGNVEFGPRLRKVSRDARRRRADEYLALVGLSGFADRRPYELSGGMQQRAQIARVLANEPAIMLMDEPFAALDAFTREHLQGELRRIWRETGRTVVFVTHNVEEAAYLATRIVVLAPRPGRVVLDLETGFGRRDEGLEELREDASFRAAAREVRAAILADPSFGASSV